MSQPNIQKLDLIFNRKSVRKFTGKKIERQTITDLLRAGMAAPTAVNRRPWSFIVLQEDSVLEKFSQKLPYAKMTQTAGNAIIVCAHPQIACDSLEEFAVIDCSCASENILLAAETMGLGAVWTALYPFEERMNLVHQLLKIPQNIIPLNLIPIGFPLGNPKPMDKYNPDLIHWEVWNSKV